MDDRKRKLAKLFSDMPPPEDCDAGRSAFFGGKWLKPCKHKAIHYITSPASVIKLCDVHFDEANAAGLISEPFIGEDEYNRREKERKEP